jgi:hypothetical protein
MNSCCKLKDELFYLQGVDWKCVELTCLFVFRINMF